jgi:hypothetical protein
VVDREFQSRSGQIKDCKIYICCFSSKNTVFRSKIKYWLPLNQNKASEWSDMSTCWICFLVIHCFSNCLTFAITLSNLLHIMRFICLCILNLPDTTCHVQPYKISDIWLDVTIKHSSVRYINKEIIICLAQLAKGILWSLIPSSTDILSEVLNQWCKG